MAEPTNTSPAASRRDNPDQWVSGGHEKFETPMRPAVSERDLREKLMRESRLQERREGGEAILHGSGPEKPSGIRPVAYSPEFPPPPGAKFYCYGVRIPYRLWRLIYGPLRLIEGEEAKFYAR